MQSGRFQLLLLTAIVFAAAGSSADARDVRQAVRLRGSILVSSNHGIYRRFPNGTLRQLTTGTSDYYPVWSRNGKRIAFESLRGGPLMSCPLMVMSSDGSGVHEVGHVTTDCSGASWGPHDHQLAFGGGPLGENGATLWAVNADGSGLRRLLRGSGGNPGGAHPAWSPNGRTIVFGWTAGRLNGLLSIRPTGRGLRQLVKPRTGQADQFLQPAWSRDGKRLAYVRSDLTAKRIFVATASAKHRRQIAGLPVNPGGFGAPTWSPRGSLIAFSGVCGPQQEGCVWTIRSRGGKRRVLIRGPYIQASWGPAGT